MLLSESCRAPTHDLALAYQLSIELAAVEGEIDIEVDAVEGALRGIHALEVLLKVLAREVGRQGDDFLDAYTMNMKLVLFSKTLNPKTLRFLEIVSTYADPSCTPDRHPRRRHTRCPRTSVSLPAPPAGRRTP